MRKNDFDNMWVLPHSNILAAGNPQRFKKYQTHSMTDYLLEIVLDHPELFPEIVELPNYQLKTNNSKAELIELFGKYNNEVTTQILSRASKDMIPANLKEKNYRSFMTVLTEQRFYGVTDREYTHARTRINAHGRERKRFHSNPTTTNFQRNEMQENGILDSAYTLS